MSAEEGILLEFMAAVETRLRGVLWGDHPTMVCASPLEHRAAWRVYAETGRRYAEADLERIYLLSGDDPMSFARAMEKKIQGFAGAVVGEPGGS